MPIIQIQQKVELMMAIYRTIFKARKENMLEDLNNAIAAIRERWSDWVLNISPRLFKDSSTNIKDIPGFDVILDIGETDVNGIMIPKSLRFIAQNPNKKDSFGNLKENAILAQTGHRIMWVINTTIENGFLGKVIDDQWIPSAPRATYPVRAGAPQAVDVTTGHNYHMDEGNWTQQLPNIDPDNTVNIVEEALTSEEECEFSIEP
jgi:hypothetical protein